jgi:hypothetical protein
MPGGKQKVPPEKKKALKSAYTVALRANDFWNNSGKKISRREHERAARSRDCTVSSDKLEFAGLFQTADYIL